MPEKLGFFDCAVWKQVFREFWFPTIVAVGWTLLKFREGDWDSWTVLIAQFGAAFFFSAYFSGQLKRIMHQQATKKDLSEIIDALKAAQERLDRFQQDVQNTLSNVQESVSPDVLKSLLTQGASVTFDTSKTIAQANTAIANTISTLSLDLSYPSEPMSLNITRSSSTDSSAATSNSTNLNAPN